LNNYSTMQETTVEAYIDELYRYAMSITRNPTDAEDLVQETYVRAIRAMGSLRAGSNHRSWLYTILRNIRINQLRRQRTAPESGVAENAENVFVETSRDPYALYVCKVDRERVREAIRQLSMGQREIIVLREYEGLSYQELAGILNCPVGTVMSRLARARSRLRALLSTTRQPCLARKSDGSVGVRATQPITLLGRGFDEIPQAFG
jgi:RNA polymerase sigma-70 factor, ECF subfamily